MKLVQRRCLPSAIDIKTLSLQDLQPQAKRLWRRGDYTSVSNLVYFFDLKIRSVKWSVDHNAFDYFKRDKDKLLEP